MFLFAVAGFLQLERLVRGRWGSSGQSKTISRCMNHGTHDSTAVWSAAALVHHPHCHLNLPFQNLIWKALL
jgi:hypothetical protein